MDQNGILISDLVAELANRLQERLALDIADGAADLDDRDAVFVRGFRAVKSRLDLICDVGDHLYGTSAKVSVTFFLKNSPVNLTSGYVGILIKVLINEALIVPKVQVCLCSIVGDEHLSMLDRIHGTRINIDIRIELLHRDLVPSCLQETSKGWGCNTFAESGDNASRDEYVFNCHTLPPNVYCECGELVTVQYFSQLRELFL